ncbi:MAG: hypothetical protein OSB25_09295 [Salibacteraceae bacterium]|nr:hypothetical protein [Salibacteraceae bacterium]|tara:strand:+ start:23691 stop:24473 length:783 start_codon:yes stop_codon:yes gene_type:complete
MKNFNKAINEGYDFDMSNYIKSAWTRVNNEMGTYVSFTLLFFIISIVVSLVPLLNFISSFVQTLLAAGFFIYASKQKEGTAEFKDFFGGFSFILPLLLFSIAYLVLLIPGFLLLFGLSFPIEDFLTLASGGGDDPEIVKELVKSLLANSSSTSGLISSLLAMIYFLYISVSYILSVPLIVLGKLDFWPAMEVSRRTIAKNFMPALGMLFLLGLGISVATVVTCGLGLLLAFPVMYIVYFEMYDQIYEVNYSEIDSEEDPD